MRNTNSNMQFSTHRRSLYWLLGLCLLLFETGLTNAQSKRTPRVTNSRSFSTNVKSTSSNGVSFDCPEEFGYYPHPTDCTQYYVCVFGGALLESCTGGLMYSHELQTCDWPRNVGCELVDSGTSATSTEVGNASRNKPQQHVPSRIRFGAAFTSPAATQKTITVPPQYHRSPPQIIPAQVQHIPPPPELAVSPNPVVTSRGQPKSLLDSQEEIAKLYAEAQETLPPVEEEESDRQQRVYRGQPSTVSQVQRDRDGILHQASINAIPNHGKIGSYTFGTAYSESLDDDVIIEHELSHNRLDVYRRRKRRDVSGLMLTTPEETSVPTEIPNDSNTSSEVMESDSANSTQQGSGETTNNSNNSNNSQEQYDEAAPLVSQLQKYSSKISQSEIGFPYTDADYSEHVEDNNDTVTGESKRRARQLRPFPHAAVKWPAHGYRSVDPPFQQPYIQKNSYSFGSFNPYLTPPSQQAHTNQNYNKLNPGPGYKAYPQQPQQQEPVAPYGKKPTLVYTGYNLSLPPPPLEDDFRPIAGNYYGAASSTSSRPPGGYQEETSQADLLPYLIQQLKELKERRKQIQTENFAYFHLDNQPIAPTTHSTTPRPSFEYFSTTKSTPQVTPNSHNAQYSTMGGFYNNNPDYVPSTSNYSGKLISQYSITQSPEPQSTTESNYFQYNIIANQKMKGVYNTAKLNQIDHAAVKVRPPVTPLQVTPNFNIVSAPNLAYNKPNDLQLIPFRDLSHLPVGISYASNTTIPESYQTFTKSISSTVPPKLDSHKPPTTAKPQMTNFQFNINEFMANLKASDLASFNPAVNPLIKYFKQVSNDGSGNIRNALILRRPVSSSTPTSTITTRAPFKSNSTPTKASISSTTQASTTPSLKGYKVFVKNTQNQINKHIPEPNQSTTTSTPRSRNSGSRTTTTQRTVEYYDEDYDDGVDEDMLPPSRMPPYMPMSETMAPPRPQVTTNVPPTTRASKIRPSVQTGFMEATTTRRPFPNFLQFNQPNAGIGVPAFISFPSDIFQELKQRLPQLQGSTDVNTQSTLRVRITNTTSTTTPTTLTTPTRIRYTVRPQRVRGQQKWQVQAVNNPDGLQRKQNETGRGAAYAKPGSSNDGLGGQHLNSIHISSNTERQRDIEYQQQQEQHQQKSQPYQSTVRQQQQSTYRPLEILTTPTPPQRPSYSSQPTLSYNTDYDEDLNAQIEQDNVYDQPTRTPQRAEAMTIQALDTRTTASTTERSAARPDGRNYYDTFTTPITNYEETDYSYSSSAEYAQNLPADYYQSEQTLVKTRPSTQAPKSKNTDDYYLIANDVAHSTSAFKVDPTKKYTTMTPTRPPISKSSSVPIRNTNKIATTTTQTVTKPPETTTTTKTTTLNPSRNNNRNRGSSIFTNQDRDTAATPNRGTHPPRTRPTLKPAGTIVSKAQEFVDIYRYPPSRPDPLYPQPTPDKTAAKCRKDVCLLPDCYCGGKDIPGGLNVSDTPQIVLITFDDAISTINIDLYDELFNNKSRKNPNGCPLRATFYLSHEWTDYGMVQDLYSDGHEMASHTVSHSFGEQFSQKKWTREIAGQREILAAYGGVKLSDVRGMRAPFLSVGGNKMYKMLYDSNFTYDSSMPVYENRPPSWPYTLDYKIFHDCMIPPCPTRSYPGVWQVPMVMWQDLNGGRCSMGDACSNPSDSEGVTKMIMKNFERHYTTNRAPFGLFYHAAWFTQPHHKEGFIKFLDAINAMQDVWIITNWQALQWVRDPTPTSRINSFQPFQCDYSDRPKRCNNPKVCNLWHKSGVRYMKTCQPCPDIYPWTGKSGIRSSRIDNEVEEPSAQN
ncbi:mucin-2 isoform X8 [Drosophila virilis]|uniref:mucin-2 isoform X8 n=1 Tax=Drosophila virilis TaxID=7244 RepID=UPI0038B2F1AD